MWAPLYEERTVPSQLNKVGRARRPMRSDKSSMVYDSRGGERTLARMYRVGCQWRAMRYEDMSLDCSNVVRMGRQESQDCGWPSEIGLRPISSRWRETLTKFKVRCVHLSGPPTIPTHSRRMRVRIWFLGGFPANHNSRTAPRLIPPFRINRPHDQSAARCQSNAPNNSFVSRVLTLAQEVLPSV